MSSTSGNTIYGMSISTKLRWKRAINELRFLHEELELVEEISSDVGAEFQAYYEKFCAKHNIDIVGLNAKHSDRIEDIYGSTTNCEDEDTKIDLLAACEEMVGELEEEADRQVHQSFNKLFKKIALRVHPDKAQDDFTRELNDIKFKEARSALEKKKYFKLIEIAQELDISLPKNYNEQVKWMKKENKRITLKVKSSKTSYNYMFSEAESDADRDDLIRSFLKQLFDFDVPQKNT